jgi:hypothetical protein
MESLLPYSICSFSNMQLWSLGAGESGKSTVLKQMKLIYAQGFSKNEKLEWKPVVFNNIIHSFRLIHDAMAELDITFENSENEVSRYIHSQNLFSFPLCFSILVGETHTSDSCR